MNPNPNIQIQDSATPSQSDMHAVILSALQRRAQEQQGAQSQPLPPGMPSTQSAPVADKKSSGPNFDDETKAAAKVLMMKLLKTF